MKKNNKLILKSRQRFRTEKHHISSKQVNKILLRAKDNQTIQSINSTEMHAYRTSKDLICKEEKTKCNKIIKNAKNKCVWWCYERKYKIT